MEKISLYRIANVYEKALTKKAGVPGYEPLLKKRDELDDVDLEFEEKFEGSPEEMSADFPEKKAAMDELLKLSQKFYEWHERVNDIVKHLEVVTKREGLRPIHRNIKEMFKEINNELYRYLPHP